MVAAAVRAGTRVVGELESLAAAPRTRSSPSPAHGNDHGRAVGHIPRGRVAVAVAGNVGTPLTALPGAIGGTAVVVCEASSSRSRTRAFAPDAAVLLNLAETLDRHGTFDAYRTAKLEAFARQPPDARRRTVRSRDPLGGEAEPVTFGPGRHRGPRRSAVVAEQRLIRVDEIRLRAPTTARTPWRPLPSASHAGCRSKPSGRACELRGVAHRMEESRAATGSYVNDSKATNVASAVVALASFPPGTVHAILGGRGKGSDYGPLAPRSATAPEPRT